MLEKGQLGLFGRGEEVLVRAGICRYQRGQLHLNFLFVETFSIQSLFFMRLLCFASGPLTSLGEQCEREASSGSDCPKLQVNKDEQDLWGHHVTEGGLILLSPSPPGLWAQWGLALKLLTTSFISLQPDAC